MSERVSRRAFLGLMGAGMAGAALAACAPKAPQATQPPAEATKPAEEAPTQAPEAPAAAKIIFSSYTWSGYEAAMRGLIEDFMAANPTIEVEGQFVPEDYYTKLQTQIAGGTPPDVGIADYGRVVSYAKSGVLLAIGDLVATSNFPIGDMIEGAVAQYRWADGDFDTGAQGGELWGLPSDAQGQIFAYNKTMFDEAGVGYPTDDWTWDDLVAAGKAITNPDANRWGFLVPHWGMQVRGYFVWQAGGEWVSPDFKTQKLDMPETAEAWKWVWDLIYTHKVAPPPGLQAATNPFMSGQVAMTIDGVWWVADFANITDFEWDLALLPKHPKTGKRTTSVESDGWWIFKATKEVEASWMLMSHLANKDGQRKFGELNYVIPSCFPEVGEEWYTQKPPDNRKKALDNLVQDSRKAYITHFEVWTILGQCMPPIDAALTDGTPIEPAIQEAAQIMQDELDKAWELYNQT